jgi:hypothetical protein
MGKVTSPGGAMAVPPAHRMPRLKMTAPPDEKRRPHENAAAHEIKVANLARNRGRPGARTREISGMAIGRGHAEAAFGEEG